MIRGLLSATSVASYTTELLPASKCSHPPNETRETAAMKLRANCTTSLLVPTSMGVRITPVNGQPVHCSDTYHMQATSAETNVASVAAYLGLPVKVLTTFVKGSPIARFIKDNLASRHMAYEGPEVEQGGPWGYRHQFNIADSGFGSRGPRVHNDRAGEVGRTLNVKDFDLDRIFGKEGVQIVHLSGLIGALSPETSKFCLELARAAKKYGTCISFDLNYRASFWKGREKELHDIFAEIAGRGRYPGRQRRGFPALPGHRRARRRAARTWPRRSRASRS